MPSKRSAFAKGGGGARSARGQPQRVASARRSGKVGVARHPSANMLATRTESASVQPLRAVTVRLLDLYRRVNPGFKFSQALSPRRTLTKPAEPASNDGWDNAEGNLILTVGDLLEADNARCAVVERWGGERVTCGADGAASGTRSWVCSVRARSAR